MQILDLDFERIGVSTGHTKTLLSLILASIVWRMDNWNDLNYSWM